ncbi:MAG: hypothetical protein E4H27_04495, partial [Anaerolineales bacterium]
MNEPILDRVIWLVFSVGLAILSAVTLAYVEQIAQRVPSDKKWWYFLLNPWLNHSLRFVYAICIPAIALFAQGALTYRGLGFKPFPWMPFVSGSGDKWLVWLNDSETMFLILFLTGLVLAYGLQSSGGNRSEHKPNIGTSLITASRESLIDQIHWAFYRELCVTFWGVALGSWIVMVPLSIELLLNPATWTKVKNVQGRTSLIAHSGILFASTILFIQTQNLWLMLMLEFTLRML